MFFLKYNNNIKKKSKAYFGKEFMKMNDLWVLGADIFQPTFII